MKNKIVKSLLIVAVVTLNSCVTVQQTKLNDLGTPEIYISQLPTKPYTEIVHFESSGSIFSSNKKLLKKLKEKGKKEGVDAIIDVQFGYIFWWPKLTGIGIKYN